MHKIVFHQIQGAVTIEGEDQYDISFDVGEITKQETIEVRMGGLVDHEFGAEVQEFQLDLTLEQAEAVLATLKRSVDILRLRKLARAIKAVYDDPEPQHGTPTHLFFEKKAKRMMEKYPEKVASTLAAYDQLLKDVNGD